MERFNVFRVAAMQGAKLAVLIYFLFFLILFGLM